MSESALTAIEPELNLSPEWPKIALAAWLTGLMAFVIQPVIGSDDTPRRTGPRKTMTFGSSNMRVTARSPYSDLPNWVLRGHPARDEYMNVNKPIRNPVHGMPRHAVCGRDKREAGR